MTKKERSYDVQKFKYSSKIKFLIHNVFFFYSFDCEWDLFCVRHNCTSLFVKKWLQSRMETSLFIFTNLKSWKPMLSSWKQCWIAVDYLAMQWALNLVETNLIFSINLITPCCQLSWKTPWHLLCSALQIFTVFNCVHFPL